MTYSIIKKILNMGNPNNVVNAEKLDVFLLNNRINEDEYNELIAILEE